MSLWLLFLCNILLIYVNAYLGISGFKGRHKLSMLNMMIAGALLTSFIHLLITVYG